MSNKGAFNRNNMLEYQIAVNLIVSWKIAFKKIKEFKENVLSIGLLIYYQVYLNYYLKKIILKLCRYWMLDKNVFVNFIYIDFRCLCSLKFSTISPKSLKACKVFLFFFVSLTKTHISTKRNSWLHCDYNDIDFFSESPITASHSIEYPNPKFCKVKYILSPKN